MIEVTIDADLLFFAIEVHSPKKAPWLYQIAFPHRQGYEQGSCLQCPAAKPLKSGKLQE